jgi:hypothetical protein
VSSSDEFNDPFSEDAGGGLLEMEGGRNIQAAKGGIRVYCIYLNPISEAEVFTEWI